MVHVKMFRAALRPPFNRKELVRSPRVASQEAGFAGFSGVAHEKFAEAAIAEHDDDAVFVYIVACFS